MKLENDPFAKVTETGEVDTPAVEEEIKSTEQVVNKWMSDTLKGVRGVIGVWVSGERVW